MPSHRREIERSQRHAANGPPPSGTAHDHARLRQRLPGRRDARSPTRWVVRGEADRVPVLRALAAHPAVAGAHRAGRAGAERRARRRRRGARGGRRLRAGAPLRPAARLAVPAARGDGRADLPDRGRHRRHRHALREPAVHGRGGRGDRPAQRRPAAARRQPGSPETALRGSEAFGYVPPEGSSDADLAREKTALFLAAISGADRRRRRPADDRRARRRLAIQPQSPGLRDRIWWGSGTRATAEWTAQQGMNLMSSTLLVEDTGVPFDELQAEQIARFRAAWAEAGWEREPRVSVSRSVLPIVSDVDRAVLRRRAVERGPGRHPRRRAGPVRQELRAASPTSWPRSWPRTPPSGRPTPC